LSRHLLVIGAQRSGSTYLYSLLDAHPEITMARPVRPEPKVFLSDEVTARGRQWYLDTYFAHAAGEPVLGEKSTSYIEDPRAASRAEQVLGTADVVAILRDPVARAVSNWRFSTANGLERRSLETALRENLAGPCRWNESTTSVSPFAYLERGRYATYLEPWLQVFGPRVHVVLLQELLTSTRTLQDLYERLGVGAFAPPDGRGPVNASPGREPDLSGDLVERLSDYFAPSDRALAAHLGRALPWRPDKTAQEGT
jgi:sulfotransferase family protein